MSLLTKLALGTMVIVAVGCGIASSSGKTADLREVVPAVDTQPNAEAPKSTQVAVFAGGCFWGVEGVFEHVKGVIDVRSGYSGGDAKTADYETVSSGDTDHAEAVQITFDPAKVTYTQLLTIFFSVAHDPTQLNRQGPDTGRQYRSAIFFANEEQKKAAQAYIEAIDRSKALPKPVVTEVVPLKKFYEAEAYHQDFMKKNPNHGYIVAHDKPKVEDLKNRFPEFYVEK
ncbi:MAG TPA: peptide-methionine (S)-S-oxide reductase MsrA [Pyrinomonadaceae bacterium]|nr:peptide-methionine (S)-S-oxide reductase MsrA [Acidobacteriota bacterium]HQZ96311.1 peptide-methionine (S)-S-oxide reductase MsrA [Pyrinomonadaceae bacterium]